MRFIESDRFDPYFNLALEEYVFENLSEDAPCFILWQNSNTIVIGKFQNTAEEINAPYVEAHGIKVVRRLSGGGAVYHDMGNLNYTFIVDQKDIEDFNFKVFTEYVVAALKSFGISAEFTGRNDIVIDGMKFCGTAQYARKGRIMHHGCIMVDSNLVNVADALKPKKAKFQSKSVKSVRSRVTTINACAEETITVKDFKSALKEQILQKQEMEPYTLTQEDLQQVEALKRKKYETWEWNYGKSPKCNFEAEEKFDFGLVTVNADIEDGVIKMIRIYGDFFGNREIHELEESLKGERIDPHLAERIEKKIHVDDYIKGMCAGDLVSLLK